MGISSVIVDMSSRQLEGGLLLQWNAGKDSGAQAVTEPRLRVNRVRVSGFPVYLRECGTRRRACFLLRVTVGDGDNNNNNVGESTTPASC